MKSPRNGNPWDSFSEGFSEGSSAEKNRKIKSRISFRHPPLRTISRVVSRFIEAVSSDAKMMAARDRGARQSS